MPRPGRRPSDVAKLERTRAAILAAAAEHVDACIASGRPVENLSMTALAKLAERVPSTVLRHFSDWHEVCAALVVHYRENEREVPHRVLQWAQLKYDRERSATAQAAREATSEDGVTRRFSDSLKSGDESDILTTANELAKFYSTRGASGDSERVISCWKSVSTRNAISLDPAAMLHSDITLLINLLEYAVEAYRTRRSSDASEDSAALSAIARLKRLDVACSTAIGSHTRAEISRFHVERAEALIEMDSDAEVRAMVGVVERLRYRDDSTIAEVSVSELQKLLARAAAIYLAYPMRVPANYINHTLEGILRMFKSSNHDIQPDAYSVTRATRTARLDARSLVRALKNSRPPPEELRAADVDTPARAESAIAYLNPTGSERREVLVGDLLRTSRFQGVGGFLVARQLAQMATMPDSTLVAECGNFGDLEDPNMLRYTILSRAIDYYSTVHPHFRQQGCAGVLSDLARNEMRSVSLLQVSVLRNANVRDGVDPDGHRWDMEITADIDELLQTVNSIVLNNIIRTRLSKRELARLVFQIEPIMTFVADPLSYAIPTDQTNSSSVTDLQT